MSGKEESRIFVGGLSWDTTEKRLDQEFSRFGKVLETQVMLEKNTGRPRGFGFVTFSDSRAVEDAIAEMHNRELDGRVISVNRAQPKMGSDDPGYGGYSGGGGGSGRGGYRSGDGPPPVGRSECFKCRRPGHWARDCPEGEGGGNRFSSRSRFGGGGRGDHFESSDRYSDRYIDDRYDGGRYGDRDSVDSRDSRFGGVRDRYVNDRYGPAGDRFASDRYGGPVRYPQNGYSKERSYDRDGGPRGGSGYDRDGGPRGGGGYDRDPPRGGGYDRDGPRGSDRYGSGGPTRYEGGASYRERPGPYDRPARGGRPSSYDDRY